MKTTPPPNSPRSSPPNVPSIGTDAIRLSAQSVKANVSGEESPRPTATTTDGPNAAPPASQELKHNVEPAAVAPSDTVEDDSINPPVDIVPTVFPASPPVAEMVETFWDGDPSPDMPPITIDAPVRPLELLEKLGPSPFPRGGFPLVGFLATTYEKVSRYALDRQDDS